MILICKEIFVRQQTDRIHSFAVLNGFEQYLSTGILFLNDMFSLILQHAYFNDKICFLDISFE